MRTLLIVAVAALCWADPATIQQAVPVAASDATGTASSSLVKPVIDATLASAPDNMQYSDGGNNANWDDIQAASEDAMLIQEKSAPVEAPVVKEAAAAAVAEPAAAPVAPVAPAAAAVEPPAAPPAEPAAPPAEPAAAAAVATAAPPEAVAAPAAEANAAPAAEAAPPAAAEEKGTPGVAPTDPAAPPEKGTPGQAPAAATLPVPAQPTLQKVRVVGDHLVLPPEPELLPPPSQTAQSGFEPEFYPPRATLIPAQHPPKEDGHVNPEYYRPPTPQPECVQTCNTAPAPRPEDGLEPEFYPARDGSIAGIVPEVRDVVEAEESAVPPEPVDTGVQVEIREPPSDCCVTEQRVEATESAQPIVVAPRPPQIVVSEPAAPKPADPTKPLPHEMETDDFLKAYPLTADQALLQKQREAAAAGTSPFARLQSRLNRVRIVPNSMQPQDGQDGQQDS